MARYRPASRHRSFRRLSRDEVLPLVVVTPLAELAGATTAYKQASPVSQRLATTGKLVGMVTHVRDGDAIEVRGVAVRIANLEAPNAAQFEAIGRRR
jgi:endonuclease YncB( thermonuclease family)